MPVATKVDKTLGDGTTVFDPSESKVPARHPSEVSNRKLFLAPNVSSRLIATMKWGLMVARWKDTRQCTKAGCLAHTTVTTETMNEFALKKPSTQTVIGITVVTTLVTFIQPKLKMAPANDLEVPNLCLAPSAAKMRNNFSPKTVCTNYYVTYQLSPRI